MSGSLRHAYSRRRMVIGISGGAGAAAVSGWLVGWIAAPAVFWSVAAAIWIVLSWRAVWPMDATATAAWATREDTTIGTTHVVLIVASVASLGGVALLLGAAGGAGRVSAGVLGLLSVAASWIMVHTVFTLGYAAQYYSDPEGGVDFNQKAAPAYAEFAYLGFTIGMTYQVSDITITDPVIRRSALQHALLSYFLGALVLAVAINTVASLAG